MAQISSSPHAHVAGSDVCSHAYVHGILWTLIDIDGWQEIMIVTQHTNDTFLTVGISLITIFLHLSVCNIFTYHMTLGELCTKEQAATTTLFYPHDVSASSHEKLVLGNILFSF